jgi:tetratricopeptide (TPR) repeat protein
MGMTERFADDGVQRRMKPGFVLVQAAVVAVVLAAQSPGARSQSMVIEECGPLQNAFGPFDYRNPKFKRELLVVETHHFTPDIASLRHGHTTTRAAGDINYTLRAFPNHHLALNAIVKLSLREKKARPAGSTYTVDCWFDRAMRFTPNDANVRILYGAYLHQIGKREDALRALKSAEKLGEDGGNFHYNIALAYIDLGQHDLALEHAHKAYASGMTLPGLKRKLEQAGKWKEPAAVVPKPAE